MVDEANQHLRGSLTGAVVADRFEVVSLLARGGMAHVYRAVQRPLGREVALKVLDLARCARPEELTPRFLREAASTAKLRHPNTVVIHDYGSDEKHGILFIAMELLEGTTLGDLVREQGPLPAGRAIHVMRQVASSIAEAHDAGLVHRDVKPGNIMLMTRGGDDDFVKVLDFGLVKERPEDGDVESSDVMVGTPRYMAPEQVAGGDVAPTADVYGLGATLFTALTGRAPFDSESRFALMSAHLGVEAPRMSAVAPDLDIPPALDDVVARCLEKDPADRYRDMRALAAALDACREEEATGTRAATSRAAAPTAATGADEDAHGALAGRWVVALIAVAVAAAALLAYVSAGDPPPPEVPAREPPTAPGTSPPTPPPTPATAGEPSSGVTPPAAATQLSSEPSGARVLRGDEDLGDTPLSLRIPAERTWTLRLELEGHEPREVTVTSGQEAVHARLDRRRARTPAPTMDRPTRQTDNRDPWAQP